MECFYPCFIWTWRTMGADRSQFGGEWEIGKKWLRFRFCKKAAVFSARQHICYSALYAITRPSVCPSVCPSFTRVDQSKTVEVRITQPSPQSSSM